MTKPPQTDADLLAQALRELDELRDKNERLWRIVNDHSLSAKQIVGRLRTALGQQKTSYRDQP